MVPPTTTSSSRGGARYVLRFDDLCPTMDRARWAPLERALIDLDIKPIVAVVPDNGDPSLMVDPPDPSFWDSVRRWQDLGWTIAVHGHRHVYVTDDPGIVRLNRRSEFAGLPRDDQRDKLEAALAIFDREGVEGPSWVAPSHSFDRATLSVLRELEIDTISDGLFRLPHRDPEGPFWVPQQLWRFRQMPPGVWTVCSHPNTMTPDGVRGLVDDMTRFRSRTTDLEEIRKVFGARPASPMDGLTSRGFLGLKRAKGLLSRPHAHEPSLVRGA